MSNPDEQLKKRLSRYAKPGDKDSVSDDEDGPSRSKLLSQVKDGQKSKGVIGRLKSQASKQRGKMVKVIKKKFPKKLSRTDFGSSSGMLANTGTHFQKASSPLYPQLKESWLSITLEDVAKDLHRLIYRVTVKTSGQRSVLLSPPDKDGRKGTRNCAETVVKLIKLLARRIMDKDAAQIVFEACDKQLEKIQETSDLIRFNRELLMAIGDDSKILRILRCVNQGLVARPYGILRTEMIKDKLTKDVRTDDGWQIHITLAKENFIQIKHVRKEQSIDFPTKTQPEAHKNHWEYEWEVSMTFDRTMNKMTQSRLSVTNLILSDGMDPALETELRGLMKDGSLEVF